MYNMLKGTYAICCASGRLLAGHMLVQNDEFREISLVYIADDGVFAFYNVPDGYG